MKPPAPIQRRTPIKQKKQSKPGQAAAERARREWAKQFPPICFVCLKEAGWPPLQIHEMARRSKTNQWRNVASYILTCQLCHDRILSWAPPDLQLAWKFLADEEHFDLAVVTELRNRAEGACTWGAVKKWIEVIQALRGER